MRHSAQAAADIKLKSALKFSINFARRGNPAQIVHRNQRARFALAAGKCNLELSAKILCGDAVVTMAVVVALPISAAAQARFGEDFFVDLAELAQRDLRFK